MLQLLYDIHCHFIQSDKSKGLFTVTIEIISDRTLYFKQTIT